MAFSFFAAGAVDKNVTHRLGGGTEEMGAVFERRALIAHQAKPGFVHQRSGLESLTGSLLSQLRSREAAKFGSQQDVQMPSGLRVTRFYSSHHLCGIAHIFWLW